MLKNYGFIENRLVTKFSNIYGGVVVVSAVHARASILDAAIEYVIFRQLYYSFTGDAKSLNVDLIVE